MDLGNKKVTGSSVVGRYTNQYSRSFKRHFNTLPPILQCNTNIFLIKKDNKSYADAKTKLSKKTKATNKNIYAKTCLQLMIIVFVFLKRDTQSYQQSVYQLSEL